MKLGTGKILVTGGAGFIGSHMCTVLESAGHEVLILDNFSNSQISVISNIEKISGKKISYVAGDILDTKLLDNIFCEFKIDAVLHFAALKAVGESVLKPIDYFTTNVQGTLNVIRSMQKANVNTFVFSSSATVYGAESGVPYTEDSVLGPSNPYGQSKLIVEQILSSLSNSAPEWRIASLRYFNPVGAHESGLIGENPSGIPNNLLPYIAQVAEGRLSKLKVFGGDYDTADGTGVRDYIHVMDLANGHLAALRYLKHNRGLLTLNLGSGKGISVMEMIEAFEKASQKKIPFEIVARRPGDLAAYWADPTKAQQMLNWRAEKSVTDICDDIWRWQSNDL